VPFPENERFARVRVARLWIWPLVGSIGVSLGFLAAGVPPKFLPIAYAAYAFFLLAALWSLRGAGIAPAEVFGRPPAEVTVWPTVIMMVPVMFCFAAMSLWATAFAASWITPDLAQYLLEQQNDDELVQLTRGGSPLLITFIVVIGPVIEEFVFRGIVLRRWMAKSTLWRGVIGSSVIFALLHPPFWLGALVVGVFLAMLYLVTRSLYAPIAFHAMYNGLVTWATLGASQLTGDQQEQTLSEFRTEWMAETALLIVSGWIVYRMIRRFARLAQTTDSVLGPPP
jgi:membrane protease YdiL (CAAX protease family)